MSNLCMMIASSTSLGMYPSERMAMPSSCLEMNPLPSRSRTLNASRISAKTNKCATQHLKWLPIIRPLIGRPPLSNDCSDLPLSLHLLFTPLATHCCAVSLLKTLVSFLFYCSFGKLKRAVNVWILTSLRNMIWGQAFSWLFLLISALQRRTLPLKCIYNSNHGDELHQMHIL